MCQYLQLQIQIQIIKIICMNKDQEHLKSSINQSFQKSIKTTYDLNSFLPTSILPSRTQCSFKWQSRHKMQTEPLEKLYLEDRCSTEDYQPTHQINEFKIKMERLSEQHNLLNQQATVLKMALLEKDEMIEKLVKQTKKPEVKRKVLFLQSNQIFVQVPPRFKQSYEVSIQTSKQKHNQIKQNRVNLEEADCGAFGQISRRRQLRHTSTQNKKIDQKVRHKPNLPFAWRESEDKENKGWNANRMTDLFSAKECFSQEIEILPIQDKQLQEVLSALMS